MDYLKPLFLGLFLGISLQVLSQKIIVGAVMDSLTASPLAYVNIGIKNQNIGTATNEDGSFHISIPKDHLKDTLTFSMVGYKDFRLPISQFETAKPYTIRLIELATPLDPVQVRAERLVERKFGIKRRNLIIHFSDGMFQETDVFEIGQLIKLKGNKARITSVNLYLFDSARDSVTFRINFYKLADGIPSERSINKSIIQRHPVKQGWLRLDLSTEDIVLEGDFIVTLEFIPQQSKDNKKVYYEVKLGGSSRSFYRKNSLGSWNTPPHHYCMYVTALVDKSIPEEPDERETMPITTIWSAHVKDSFNIFLRLPNDYQKKNTSIPIIYCLDANAYFDHLCQIVADLKEKKKLKVEPIIVGIGYKNAYLMDSLRVRDYTFPKALPSDSMSLSGGGYDFYNFIKTELIPYMAKTYRHVETKATLMGHSFGGYFVTLALLFDQRGNPLFQNYIAVSPTLWYHNGYLVEQFNALSTDKDASNKQKLYLTIGEEELKHDDSHNFELLKDSINSFSSIDLKSKVYPNMDHMGVAIPSFEDATEILFGE